ncbi:MAG: hypothetical protein WCG22_00950 [Lentisphaerota bacterium]
MILNTTVVTYLLLSILSLAIGVVALVVGVAVARKWDQASPSDQQYQLEKKVYLCMTLVMLGLYIRLTLVPLWFFMLQSFIPSIPGAMCLCGVHLLKTPDSFIATALKFLVPMVYGYWLVLNALDRKIETQPLMKRKLYSLIPLAGLMFLESFFDLRFVFAVKPRFVNCCSSLFDDSSSALLQSMTYNGWGWVVAFFIASLALVVLSAVLVRRPRYHASLLLGALSAATLCTFVLALHTRLSPLFLHAAFHHCVFCVWQKLPDMIAATAAIYIGCWATLIYAALRNMANIPAAATVAVAHTKRLLQWAVASLLLGSVLVAVRLAAVTVMH